MRAALVWVVIGASACGGAAPIHTGSTALEIGGGQGDTSPEFLPIADGDDVLLHVGSQGGFHVYLNLRWTSDAPPPMSFIVDRTARRETGELVSTARNDVAMVLAPADPTRSAPEPEVFETAQSMRMFLCPTPIGIAVKDQILVVTVNAFLDEQSTQPMAETTIRMRPRCPTDTHADLCTRICSG
jgi:hypothetical protein